MAKKSSFRAKKLKSAKKTKHNAKEKLKIERVNKQIQSDLSPKFTAMKTGERISRFGRPQKIAQQDANSIPTDIAKFIPKHSPKRLKPKEQNIELDVPQDISELVKNQQPVAMEQDTENIPSQHDKENLSSENNLMELETKIEIEEEKVVISFSPQAQLPEEQISDALQENQEREEQTNGEICDSFPLSLMTSNDEAPEAHSDAVSDTDSALGSAGSCSDHKEDEFVVGQILWGGFSRESWWPCIVCPIDDSGAVTIENEKKQKQVHVKYFDWTGKFSFLSVNNVFDFKDVDDFWKQIEKRKIMKTKVKAKTKSSIWNKAIEEAKIFKKMDIEKRLKTFESVVKIQLETKASRRSMDLKVIPDAIESAYISRSLVERKSVDSALEVASPAPSSPSEEAASVDPIAFYFEQMNSSTKSTIKRESKFPRIRPVEIKQEDDDPNRRKSVRRIKKRSYDDFQQDFKYEDDAVSVVSSPVVEQKAKKIKIDKEETLEERFVINAQSLRAIFKNISKKRVCIECFIGNAENTLKCTKCSGWYHEGCAGHSETKYEEIRHQTGDSDEIIQTQTLKQFITCKSCFTNTTNCFVCTKAITAEDESETSTCPSLDCRLSYHKKCLRNFPQKCLGNRRKHCPQHTCHTCFSKDIHNSGPLIRCVKCPAAYHLQLSCVPAGTQILSQSQCICPRHEVGSVPKGSKELKALNIDYCSICQQSGDSILICCESCPAAFCPNCINYQHSADDYYCRECQEGRLPLYNSIVWARVGAYRWWPGLIMPNAFLPDSTLKSQKSKREFCVRFFGSYDYYWFTCERVFKYEGGDLATKGKKSKLDEAFYTALNEAQTMLQILNEGDNLTSTAKPKPYQKITQNRPVAPVKLKKIGEPPQPCNCKPTDPNPCGRLSDCINMHLNFECHKTCPAGEKCQNQKLRNRDYAPIEVVKTSHRGFGAVAIGDIAEDTLVVEYCGDLIDTTEFNRRMSLKIAEKEKDFYFLTVEGDLYVDAEPAGNLSRFINHSCEPNCLTRKVLVDGNTRIGIFTNQAIAAGTELTFDYQMEFVGNKKTACYCGSAKCSGLIGEKPKEQEKKSNGKKVIKKLKRRAPQIKISIEKPLPTPRVRTPRDARDPLQAMLKRMSRSPKADDKVVDNLPEEKEPKDSDSTLEQAIENEPQKMESEDAALVIESVVEVSQEKRESEDVALVIESAVEIAQGKMESEDVALVIESAVEIAHQKMGSAIGLQQESSMCKDSEETPITSNESISVNDCELESTIEQLPEITDISSLDALDQEAKVDKVEEPEFETASSPQD